MKNPLRKRVLRDLKGELGKNIALFLFLAATIAICSGFLIAGDSMVTAYNEGFEKYNIEDGHFELKEKASDDLIAEVEAEGVNVSKLYYKEESMKGGKTLRVFKNRTSVNRADVMKGSLPETKNEIALDRLYATNNNIEVGEEIQVSGHKYKVSGYVALSDYNALFQSNGETMFDASGFGVAVTTVEGFQRLGTDHLHYQYAWKNKNPNLSDKKKNKITEEIGKVLASYGEVEELVQQGDNQAISYSGDDLVGDRSMVLVLLYIVIVIMGFAYGVTTRSTLEREAGAIGTLMASGYTKGELMRHYMTVPVLVTVVAAIVGNILGYTVTKTYVAGIYYHSYSLPTYHTLWNSEAFLLTTVVPGVMVIIIDLLVLRWTFKIKPLQFLRHDLKPNKKKKSAKLPNMPFLAKFRTRILIQNRVVYVIMAIGIFFASFLMFFGLMLQPALLHYADQVKECQLAKYQYVLKQQVSTTAHHAEKISMMSLQYGAKDEISVYGVRTNSEYLDVNLPDRDDQVVASSAYMDKYSLKVGDKVTLTEKYTGEKHTFTIEREYDYDVGLALFMSRASFDSNFDMISGYFNGYFSNEKIEDIEDKYISSVITEDDLMKLANQLQDSMGSSFRIFTIFSTFLYMLMIYLMAQLIVNKNSEAISMIKILGYEDWEVNRLYNRATAIVVMISLLMSTWLSYILMGSLWKLFLTSMSGWLSYYIAPMVYVKMVAVGIVAYFLIEKILQRRIRRIPLSTALKNMD